MLDFDLPTILGAAASIGVVVEAFFIYKMYREEQDTYALEQKRFLLKKNGNTLTSFVNKFTRNGWLSKLWYINRQKEFFSRISNFKSIGRKVALVSEKERLF